MHSRDIPGARRISNRGVRATPAKHDRRPFMRCLRALLQTALLLGTMALPSTDANAQTKLRMILDWKYQAQMGVFFLAADRGYFRDESLEVSMDQGEGAGAAAPKILSGTYDLGFGSIDSVVMLNATRPTEAPVAVFLVYGRAPFVIAVKSDSHIKSPKDLEGKTVGGPANDGALKLFPAFAKATGVDPAKVTVTNMAPNLRAQMLMRGQVDAVFSFRTAMFMDIKLMGGDPAKDLRFLAYEDHGVDLYSNAIIVSRRLTQENPAAVQGFLRALTRGIKDAIADPEAAVQSVIKREPLLNAEIERERLQSMFKNDMNAAEAAEIGLGDVVDSRLERTIKIVVDANGLPRTPAPTDVFDRRFLPPAAERVKKL
jgi:NitT/TauT family transport system substrate-binding protein